MSNQDLLQTAWQKNENLQSEIGDLLKRRLLYEKMVADISTLAIASEDPSLFQQECLEIIGETSDLSRTYIFEHRHETDVLDNTFEWFAPEISPQKEHLQGIPAREAPWWVEIMRANRIVNCKDIEELPYEAERHILRSQQIKSVLAVPLFVKKVYYGFIGLDECRRQREWPPEDVALLRTVSEIISMVLGREQDRQVLIEKEALLRATIDSLPFDLFVIDKGGRYSVVNSRLRSRWGEATGKRPEEFSKDKEILSRWLANNRRAFSGETVRGEVQYKIKGKTENFYNIISPVKIGDEINAIVGINIDITDRKRMEDGLRENEERFRAIFNNAAVGIALTSISGHILKANDALCKFLGYSQEELKDMHSSDFTHPQDLDTDTRLYGELIEGVRNRYMLDKKYVRKDGKAVWGRLGLSIIRETDGSPKYAIGTCEDITERKRAEEELRRAKEELEIRVQERTAELSQRAEQLARLSSELTLAEQRERRRVAEILHDHLQQFLIAARINCELFFKRSGMEHQQDADTIITLITQSIQTSRTLTAELSPPILQQGRLSAALEWLAHWMQENNGLTVELQSDPNLDPKREDVRTLLFQSTRELLFNVVKHAGVISARIEMFRDEGNRLRVVVTDRGCGFDPDTIWEKAQAGTGFGLLSIRERMALMGGSLEIESSPGNGASFSLAVPLEKAGEPEEIRIGKKDLEPHTADRPGEKIRVLVADDHTVVRQGVSIMLNLYSDIEIAGEASDGEEAVNLTRKLRPDVVLMDISMPKMNGLEATRIIHSEFPNIRIIGLSMYNEEDQSIAMMSAGASAYRLKTDSMTLLLDAIRGTG